MRHDNRFVNYSFESFRRDLIAGTMVGIIALPLAMAFAIASGVNPEFGIYTTIIAGICVSLFGGSKFQIAGPTGAFVPILLGIVLQYGYNNLLLAGFMAGIMLVLMGIFKLGVLIKFIPRPVTIGFTSGIAVLIFSSQIANFLGLSGLSRHQEFMKSMLEIYHHLPMWNGYAILTSAISLATILLSKKIAPKYPSYFIGLIISTIVTMLLFGEHVATIESTFGKIAQSLPTLSIPTISMDKIQYLIRPAFVIAMLGGIESLLSAVVADGMTSGKHNSNRELIGQGIANMITPLFGGIPATGAIARTATNIKNGAASPISGIVHSVIVLLILLIFAPLASAIPLAAMAPILMIVAWNMSEQKEFIHILKTKSSDSIVLVITFLLTIFADLTVAVEIGLLLAIVIFVKRMSELLTVSKVLPDPTIKNNRVQPYMVNEGHDCPQISIYSIDGPLFFGAANYFEKTIMDTLRFHPRVLLLRMSKVPFIDATGENNLASIVQHFKSLGGIVLISGIQHQPLEYLHKSELYEEIGSRHFFDATGDAINYALNQLDSLKCLGCKHFAFQECQHLSTGSRNTKGVAKV